MVEWYISHKSKKKVVIKEMPSQYLINAYNFYDKQSKNFKSDPKLTDMQNQFVFNKIVELTESLKAEITNRNLTI